MGSVPWSAWKGIFSAVTRSQVCLFYWSALKDIYNLFVIYWNLPGSRGAVSWKLQPSQLSTACSALFAKLPSCEATVRAHALLWSFEKRHVMPCTIYSIIFFIKTLRGYNRWWGCTEKGRTLRVCVLRLDKFAGNSGQSRGSRNLVSKVNDVERYFKPKLKSF